MKMVKEFFDKDTWTLTYLVWDENKKDVVIIDPVMDYDPAASKLKNTSAQHILNHIENQGLRPILVLETHAHADHISGSQIFKDKYPDIKIAIGSGIKKVQEVFKKIYNLPDTFKCDGSQFDKLLNDDEVYKIGSFEIRVIATPGHTPACSSYFIDGYLFSGDAIFMPDSGTGRCDFPAASAEQLYHSIHEKMYKLPDSTKICVGHDYMPQGRPLKFMCELAEQKKLNIHLKSTTTKEEFVKFRTERDKTLSAPRLLLPSIQINIDAGKIPRPESNGGSYLKIPISF